MAAAPPMFAASVDGRLYGFRFSPLGVLAANVLVLPRGTAGATGGRSAVQLWRRAPAAGAYEPVEWPPRPRPVCGPRHRRKLLGESRGPVSPRARSHLWLARLLLAAHARLRRTPLEPVALLAHTATLHRMWLWHTKLEVRRALFEDGPLPDAHRYVVAHLRAAGRDLQPDVDRHLNDFGILLPSFCRHPSGDRMNAPGWAAEHDGGSLLRRCTGPAMEVCPLPSPLPDRPACVSVRPCRARAWCRGPGTTRRRRWINCDDSCHHSV
jgi:hypothetical protein